MGALRHRVRGTLCRLLTDSSGCRKFINVFPYNDRRKIYFIHVPLCLGSGEEENNVTKAKTRFALQTN